MASLLATLQHCRLWLLFLCFFLMMAGMAIMSPHVTPLAVNYFASLSGGAGVVCEDFTQDSAPPECKQGNATAVSYVSVTSFFSNTVLGLLISPVMAWLSDSYGRKPFFLASLVLNATPFVWLAAHLHFPAVVSFVGFYAMDGLKGMIVPLSLIMSATADVTEPGLRATIFSFIMVELSVAMICFAGVGGLLSATTAANTSVALFAASIVLYSGFMPETLSDEAKAVVQADNGSPALPRTVSSAFQTMLEGLKDSLSVLTRSQLFFKLALIMAATGIVFECIMDLLFNYLSFTMSFGASQFSSVMIVLGVSGLLVQVWPEKWILVSSLIASAFEMIVFVVAPALGTWAVYLALVVGAPGSMSFPVISALKSVHAGPEEQGKVQGALFAARAAAQGAGPLLFSAMFTYFTQHNHFFPGAPLLGLAVIMALGAAVACSLKVPPVPTTHTAVQHGKEADDDSSPGEERIELLPRHTELLVYIDKAAGKAHTKFVKCSDTSDLCPLDSNNQN